MLPFWRLEFGGDAKIFGKSVDTCIKADVLIGRKGKQFLYVAQNLAVPPQNELHSEV
jgi:hypothetical protein